jgi:hypothetical protein
LEQENQYLKSQLSNLRQGVETADGSSDHDPATSLLDAPTLVLSNQPIDVPNEACRRSTRFPEGRRSQASTAPSKNAGVAKRAFSPDRESCYHGPTIATIDEETTETTAHQNEASSTKVPDMWIKRHLVAESARQRQLETVNLLAGKLDFDGVDQDLGMHLLSIYWSRQQSLGPVVYRTVFMRDMACSGSYFSKLLLNAVYFYACKYTTRIEVRHNPNDRFTAGWVFRERAVALLRDNFETSTVTTIQALLLMSSALFTWCDEKSTSWLYAGMAFNMIIDLGLHVEATTLKRRFSEEELEIRRRVFWSAYGMSLSAIKVLS